MMDYLNIEGRIMLKVNFFPIFNNDEKKDLIRLSFNYFKLNYKEYIFPVVN